MTKTEYDMFIDEHPRLTTCGIGVDNGKYNLVQEHAALKDHHEAFEVCCEMLRKSYLRNDHGQYELTSYCMKHQAENYASDILKKDVYVPEGAFVASVFFLNLPYRKSKKAKTGIALNLKKIPWL
jgi:hypothetical protein